MAATPAQLEEIKAALRRFERKAAEADAERLNLKTLVEALAEAAAEPPPPPEVIPRFPPPAPLFPGRLPVQRRHRAIVRFTAVRLTPLGAGAAPNHPSAAALFCFLPSQTCAIAFHSFFQ